MITDKTITNLDLEPKYSCDYNYDLVAESTLRAHSIDASSHIW